MFADRRIDEQLTKALDRKVWLPSGGSLVIDRTEAMTVVDVNTGKFVGSGGNLEQTVTRNNMEAAEEIVRQLRLRDIGGIIVIDFIDMVLESNRDLVLRRLTECLGRDRTKHQVAEVTSLGLVQMTRKRVGQGLLEVFSEPCEHCRGRGVLVHTEPVDEKRRGGGGGGGGGNGSGGNGSPGGSGRRERSSGRDGGGGGKDSATDSTKDGATDVPVDTAADVETPDTPADDEGSTRSGGRRTRGRRNRGQSGEERAAEDAAVLTAVRSTADDAEVDARDAVQAALDAQPAEASVAEPAALDELPQVAEPVEPRPEDVDPVQEHGSDPVPAAARPRRRRAASRPAGPPV